MYYPHVIHNELLTHRVFSRNSASSRAIPVTKMIESVLDDPYWPLKWYKNKPGMQGSEELTGRALIVAKVIYADAIRDAIRSARRLSDPEVDAHKQIANRILNPYMHILVLVSSTQWSNFLHVRDHEDAEPSMELLAKAVRAALDGSKPLFLKPGEWHLPFVNLTDENGMDTTISGGEALTNAIKLSVARCASTSYKTVEGYDMTLGRALVLHNRLVASDPVHASPTEHQAKVDDRFPGVGWCNPERSGNLGPGWVQYRKTIPGECR
jgi:thymidylate synthase ThyX